MKKLLIITFILSTSNIFGQFIDNYGVKVGVGLSNQHWQYNIDLLEPKSGWKQRVIGFTGQFYIEKNIIKSISVKAGLGYIQKGLEEKYYLSPSEDQFILENNKITFHNLSFDLSTQLYLFTKSIKPYILVGIRSEYLIKYQHSTKILNTNSGNSIYDGFKKFNTGVLLGAGVKFNDKYTIDFIYNPSITNNLNNELMKIKTKYASISIGVNINQLINS